MQYFLTFAVYLFLASSAFCQDTVFIPFATSATIDGMESPLEWSTASKRTIQQAPGRTTTVSMQHDGSTLFVRFEGNLASSIIRFPEVLIDVNNDKSTSWDSNDWWFHVSATDCESNGTPADYSNCEAVRPTWKAEPNMSMSGQTIDTIEIAIPFNLIGVTKLPHHLGLALEVTNTATEWEYWPVDAQIANPSSWGEALLLPQAASVNRRVAAQNHVRWISSHAFNVPQFYPGDNVAIVDALGKERRMDAVTPGGDVDVSALAPGVYFVLHATSEGITAHKIIR
jgi:hypothetical protein